MRIQRFPAEFRLIQPELLFLWGGGYERIGAVSMGLSAGLWVLERGRTVPEVRLAAQEGTLG